MEKWKSVPEYVGIYEVSDQGRVRTTEGKTTHSKLHGKRVWKSRVLKEKNPSGRDVRVSLWKNKKPKSFLVHRLVGKAFIPNPEKKPCINHIDGNPRNNCVSNLDWAGYKENQNHAVDNDLSNTNIKIALIDGEGKRKEFRSMAKASLYLGKNKGYISNLLKRGKNKIDDFTILK